MLLFNSERTAGVGDRPQFKNISCYCLTEQGRSISLTGNKFKNISCYCLTLQRMGESMRLTNLKTSHVIV